MFISLQWGAGGGSRAGMLPGFHSSGYPSVQSRQQQLQRLQMMRQFPLPPQMLHNMLSAHRYPTHGEGYDGGYEEEDRYSGLMLQREKDWVVKIQLLQLHTDNPYADDYYYTVRRTASLTLALSGF